MKNNGKSHRDPTGRFLPGCPPGPGNPHLQRVRELRQAMLAAVTPDDVKAIVKTLIEQAKSGDVLAAREVLNRVCGKPAAVTLDGEELMPLPPIVILGHPQTPDMEQL